MGTHLNHMWVLEYTNCHLLYQVPARQIQTGRYALQRIEAGLSWGKASEKATTTTSIEREQPSHSVWTFVQTKEVKMGMHGTECIGEYRVALVTAIKTSKATSPTVTLCTSGWLSNLHVVIELIVYCTAFVFVRRCYHFIYFILFLQIVGRSQVD